MSERGMVFTPLERVLRELSTPVLKTTTEVQDALLLSRRRAKKKFGDEEQNGVAKKNFRGFHCFPNTPHQS